MKINCFRTKFTALFLSLVLIWLSVPVGSIDLTLDDSLIKEEATLQTNSSALTEDISLRDEFTKHYYDSDGNYYAVVYPEQVHYKENNEWKEVDNTLSFDSTTKKYTTNGPEFATTFANSTSSNQLVSISDGEYTLSWTVSFPNNQDTELSTMSISSTEITESSGLTISASTAQISQIETDAENEITTKETVGKVGKTISSVRYKNVFNNSVDLRYSVLHGKVEEDIILYSPEGFTSYTLTVNTGGLTAIKLPDNTIIFANEDGEGIFNLGAPWMKDSGVSVTDDITVNVVQRGNYAYITYIPNSEWLNDTSRIYPVLIDPSFTTRKYLSNYEDTYVFTGDSASATRATETTMKVGKIDSKTHYSYIKILDIPDLVKTSHVSDAKLRIWHDMAQTVHPALSLYEVEESWASNSITFANQPSSSLVLSGVTRNTDGYYEFDLGDWMYDKGYDYQSGTNAFFESPDWNGFKIGCTNESSLDYAILYTSNYEDEDYPDYYWPIMLFEYSYTPYEYIENGAIYSFINAASNMYLTVSTSTTTAQPNAYQYGTNIVPAANQSFKLEYSSETNAYLIRSEYHTNKVLNYSYGFDVDDTEGYTPANVYAYTAYSGNNYNEWLIEAVGTEGLFKIVPRADGNLALTSIGTSGGSASGSSVTATGNVVVAEYDNESENQHWMIKTGDTQIMPNHTNIREADASGEPYIMFEGSTYLSYCCPLWNYGDSVSWSSSNTNVATVDDDGAVTGIKAGSTEITATVYDEDGLPTHEYSQTVFVVIPDGIYMIENVNTGYELAYETLDSTEENAPLTMLNTGTSSTTSRAFLFKIKHLGDGTYSIRSMLSNDMGLTLLDEELVSTTIGCTDDVVDESRWHIESDASGYYLYAPNDSATMTSPTSYGQPVTMETYSSTNTRQKWRFIPVTGTHGGVTIKNKTDYLVVGESYDFDAGIYSSTIDENGQSGTITWSVTNGTGSATINSSTGVLTGTSQGMVTVTATYRRSSSQIWSSSFNVYIIPIKDGTYFFKNKDTAKFMQPDDDGNPFMEQHNFAAEDSQRWELIHYENGYYQIKNRDTGLYLTSPDNTTDGASITEQAFSTNTSSRQLWKFTHLSNGAYKVQAQERENTSLVLAVGWGANWNGINVEQRNYSNDSNYKDEWEIRMTDTYAHLTLSARVYYDSSVSVNYSESQLQAIYNDAAAYFMTEFNIRFFLTSVSYSSELDCSAECHATSLNGFCDESCASLYLCTLLHHRSSDRLLEVLKSNDYYTYRLVGYAVCDYSNGIHEGIVGSGDLNGKNALSSILVSPDIINSIQHELSHNLGASHDDCLGDNCTLDGDRGQWCDACINAIKSNY